MDEDDDPWAQEYFYGGDDDPILIKRKRKLRKRVTEVIDSKETMSDKIFNAPPPPLVDDILPSPEQGLRTGDARYIAPETALKDLSTLIGHSLKPEELRHRHGTDDPIRLPVEIGKFLEAQSSNELVASWGSILGSPDPSLLTPQGGFSTATGRLATLSVCCEAMQGPPNEIDTAVQLGLHRNAWEHCREVAKVARATRRLTRTQDSLGGVETIGLPMTSGPLPKPNILGGLALQQILPPEMAFLVPSLFIPPEEDVEEEDLLAHLDMVLSEFTGKDPFAPPSSPTL